MLVFTEKSPSAYLSLGHNVSSMLESSFGENNSIEHAALLHIPIIAQIYLWKLKTSKKTRVGDDM